MEVSRRDIKNKIFSICGIQLMLDSDLEVLYQTETKFIDSTFKRNPQRFPVEFMFQLNEKEVYRVSQNAMPSKQSLCRYMPYVFNSLNNLI